MAEQQPVQTNTLIIGASAAGLATAACLKRAGIDFILLEQHDHIAHAWRNHYDRLHLHSSRQLSGLPYFPMPRHYPKYPAREQVVEYLEAYRAHFDIQPRFKQQVSDCQRIDRHWQTVTGDTTYHSQNVVVAIGYTRRPHMPTWPGHESFSGPIVHSSEYKNGRPYQGQDVLVVGFGNSGGEIAIDLHEHSARPAMAVRSPVNVIPREVLGLNVLRIGAMLEPLPPKLADVLNWPLNRLLAGDVTRLGVHKRQHGAMTQISKARRIPLIDIGTTTLIEQGHITIYPGLESIAADGVLFVDGRKAHFDAIVLATGYRPALADFLPQIDQVADEKGVPHVSGGRAALPGLYFCGLYVSPAGMLYAISHEARRIGKAIARS